LLDVHITPKVAVALKRRFPALDVKSIHETDWAALPDEVLLEFLDAGNFGGLAVVVMYIETGLAPVLDFQMVELGF